MPAKKDNYYQHAEIIIDRMIKKNSLSQNKFAKEILGIAGGNITEARKTGKIPDNWFPKIEKKLGVTKDELTSPPTKEELTKSPTRITSTLEQPYGDAHENNGTTSEPLTGLIRKYREISELDDDILMEIQTWLNDLEKYRPGFTAWFRL